MAKVSKRHGHARTWGSKRATLKQHLEGQWMRGQGSPYDRAPREQAPRVDFPKVDPLPYEPVEPPTLGDVWPSVPCEVPERNET